jgi:hypothetical protein
VGVLAAIMVAGAVRAQSTSERLPRLYFGANVIAHQILKASGDVTGASSPVASVLPGFGFAFRLPIKDAWAFMPSVSFTLLGRETQDESATVRLLPLQLDLVRRVGAFDFRAGPGVLMTIISGNGGTLKLDNGTTTSDFARPAGLATSTLLYLGLGAGSEVGGKLRWDATLLLQSILSERRAFSVMGQVGYEIF